MRELSTREDLESFLDDRGTFEIAVWDFDGVIVDSEPSQAEAYRTLLERRGFTPAANFFTTLAGQSEREIWSALKDEYGFDGDIEALRRERIGELLTDFVDDIPPNWFVEPALAHFERTLTRSIVISSGNTEVI